MNSLMLQDFISNELESITDDLRDLEHDLGCKIDDNEKLAVTNVDEALCIKIGEIKGRSYQLGRLNDAIKRSI